MDNGLTTIITTSDIRWLPARRPSCKLDLWGCL